MVVGMSNVYKTRGSCYHVDKDCRGIESATRYVKEIDLELAEAWDLHPCGYCVTEDTEQEQSKWHSLTKQLMYD